MTRLTVKDAQGNWALKGVRWEDLREGKVITKEMWERLYGALWRLMEYEDTGLEPAEVVEVNSFDKTNTSRLLGKLADEQEKNRWIPVRERLPEAGEHVIVSFKCTGFQPVIAHLSEESRWMMLQGAKGFNDVTNKVSAWRPLPEPYRPERSRDDLD